MSVCDSTDRRADGLDDLAGWAADDDPENLFAFLTDRYRWAITEAAATKNAFEQAARLRRRRVPTAFVPGLVALLGEVNFGEEE